MNHHKLDPESMKLWEEIKQLEEQKDCCKLIKEYELKYLHLYFMGFRTKTISVNYCPECGRKIEWQRDK